MSPILNSIFNIYTFFLLQVGLNALANRHIIADHNGRNYEDSYRTVFTVDELLCSRVPDQLPSAHVQRSKL